MNDTRGSCWRRWDLHIHTPHSALNNGFGSDFDLYAKELFTRAVDNKIACVGVTDYFLIEGYKKLRNILTDESRLNNLLEPSYVERVKQILFLPNIEFRGLPIIQTRNTQGQLEDSRVNFHIIFDNSISPETIEEDFLRELKFSADGAPATPDEKSPITERRLTALGEKLKTEHPKFQGDSDLFVGMINAVVDYNEAVKILEGQPSKFHGKYLLGLACDEDLSRVSWDGQGHLTRKLFYQSSHFLFSSNRNTRKFALGKCHNSIDEYLTEFKTIKPCFHGSDAHSFGTLFAPAENRFNWLKTDPTFEGLRKTLIEPEDRVFIGERPEKLQAIEEQQTKFIESISIKKAPKSDLQEHWFDCNIPINPGFVAIIGNKGGGKSALGETLGLLGHTANADAFSFLNNKKFRQPKNNKATHFVGSLAWVSGRKNSISLDKNPDPNDYELVKYIPQNYLETLCNELGSADESRFEQELRSVIFSHVPEEKRLGKNSLEDLLEYQTAQSTEKIEILQSELNKITSNIVRLEDRGSVEYTRKIEGELAAKKHALESHIENKPTAVPKPETLLEQENNIKNLNSQISQKRTDLFNADKAVIVAQNELSEVNKLLSVTSRLLKRIENFDRQINTFKNDVSADIDALKLEIPSIISLNISTKPIIEKRSTLLQQSNKLESEINLTKEGSKAAAKEKIKTELAALQNKLDAPHKAYEAYLGQKSAWDISKNDIVGSKDIPETVEYYKEQLKQLTTVPNRLELERKKAADKAGEIFLEKDKLVDIYRALYAPVQNFIQSSSVAGNLQLRFNVEISDTGFDATFFSYLSQGVRGTYCGTHEGRKRLRSLLSGSDISTQSGIEIFVKKLVDSILVDERDEATETETKLKVRDQMRKGQKTQSLYNFVYGLNYLQPRYSLGVSGKSLQEISPGERGALLLVFYLLVDQNNTPFIIDQPEENLDNQTVYKLIVPCIKEARKRRQIIAITHNPNLAVVCDAEQVIVCSIDKKDGNRLNYISGAIENPRINKLIVDILEGTRPAFDNRDSKYEEVKDTS